MIRYIPFIKAGSAPPTGEHPLDYDGSPTKYGESCDVSYDGSTIAISDKDYQKVWVFTDPDGDGSWPLQQTIDSPDSALSSFGYGVSLSGDGNVLTVLASDLSKTYGRGVICIFDRSAGTWTHTESVYAPDTGTSPSGFAWAISINWYHATINKDGDRLFAGDPEATDVAGNTGFAMVWLRSSGTFSVEDEVIPTTYGYEGLGYTVDANGDGSTMLLSNHYAGFMTVRTRSGTTWTDEQQLSTADTGLGVFIPTKVMLSDDGDTAAYVSYSGADDNASFTRSAGVWSTADTWNTTAATNDLLLVPPGRIADIDGTGSKLMIGAYNATVSGNPAAGKVVPFTGGPGAYVEGTEITMPGGSASNAKFGYAVAMPGDGSFVVVTAPGATGPGGTGLAWVIYL